MNDKLKADLSASMSKEDLFFLLESYENTIRLNTTLLEQQNKLLDQHGELLKQQNDINANLKVVLNNFSDYSKDISELHAKVVEGLSAININQAECRKECSTEHGGLTIRAYVGWVGMAAIIISLITLLISTFDKFSLIHDIAKHLGVH